MIYPLIAVGGVLVSPADRVRDRFAKLLKPPVSLAMTLGKGSVKIVWELPTSQSERFRIQLEAEVYEFRGAGTNFIEIDWIGRQYEKGTMPANNVGPFGEIDGTLPSAYPFIARSRNLTNFLKFAKGKNITPNHVQLATANEKLDVVFGSAGAISKFTQTVSGRQERIVRDWVVTSVTGKAAAIVTTPPTGMVPASIPIGTWNFDSSEPISDLSVTESGVNKRLSQVLGANFTIIELVAPEARANPDLAAVAKRHRAKSIAIGPRQTIQDPTGAWQRVFAEGGYPVVLLLDRSRRIHMAFQGMMPEMVGELETYLKGR